MEEEKLSNSNSNSMKQPEEVPIDTSSMSINGIRIDRTVYFNEMSPISGQISRRVVGKLVALTESGTVFIEELEIRNKKNGETKFRKILHAVNYKDIKEVI